MRPLITAQWLYVAVACLSLSASALAEPWTSATVTRTENKVSVGASRADRSALRPARVSDVISNAEFLLSEANSRAELQYPDGSLVRVGQNTVFSFDAGSRTLSLEKGTLLFHIPKGSGGGRIKTTSLTAAVTGTAGKVGPNLIAIVEGEIRLVPSGQIVRAGQFARRNADGTIVIANFDPSTITDGRLVYFNGPMPGFTIPTAEQPQIAMAPPDLRNLEVLHRTQNLPNSIRHFFPDHGDNGGNKNNKDNGKDEDRDRDRRRTTPAPRPRSTPTTSPSPTFNPITPP